MKKFASACVKWLLEKGVLEKNYYDEYPALEKEWVDEVRNLREDKINMRFLTGKYSAKVFLKYKLRPLKIFPALFGKVAKTAS